MKPSPPRYGNHQIANDPLPAMKPIRTYNLDIAHYFKESEKMNGCIKGNFISFWEAIRKADDVLDFFDFAQARVDAFVFWDSRKALGEEISTICVLKSTGDTIPYKEFMKNPQYDHSPISYPSPILASSQPTRLKDFEIGDFVYIRSDINPRHKFSGNVIGFKKELDIAKSSVQLRLESSGIIIDIPCSSIRYSGPDHPTVETMRSWEDIPEPTREALIKQESNVENRLSCPECGLKFRSNGGVSWDVWYCPSCRSAIIRGNPPKTNEEDWKATEH